MNFSKLAGNKKKLIGAIIILTAVSAYGIYISAYLVPLQNKRISDCQRLVQIANERIARMDQGLLGLSNVTADAISYANNFNASELAIRGAQFAQFETSTKNSDDASTRNNCLDQ